MPGIKAVIVHSGLEGKMSQFLSLLGVKDAVEGKTELFKEARVYFDKLPVSSKTVLENETGVKISDINKVLDFLEAKNPGVAESVKTKIVEDDPFGTRSGKK